MIIYTNSVRIIDTIRSLSLQSDADLHVARKLKDMGNDFIRLTKET